MDLKEFSSDLNQMIIDKEITELKLKGIEQQIGIIKKLAEKQEKDSSVYYLLMGIADVMENIINQ